MRFLASPRVKGAFRVLVGLFLDTPDGDFDPHKYKGAFRVLVGLFLCFTADL